MLPLFHGLQLCVSTAVLGSHPALTATMMMMMMMVVVLWAQILTDTSSPHCNGCGMAQVGPALLRVASAFPMQ